MFSTTKFFTICLVIAIYLVALFGLMYLYFKTFGENLTPILAIVFGFGILSNLIIDRLFKSETVRIWQRAFCNANVEMVLVSVVGGAAIKYIQSTQASVIGLGIVFLLLTCAAVYVVLRNFAVVFEVSGFNLFVRNKKKKAKEVI